MEHNSSDAYRRSSSSLHDSKNVAQFAGSQSSSTPEFPNAHYSTDCGEMKNLQRFTPLKAKLPVYDDVPSNQGNSSRHLKCR